MARHILIAALAAAMFGCLPAHAQEDMPELDGGPPPLRIPKQQPAPQPAKPVTAAKPPITVAKPAATTSPSLKAEQDRLAKQAASQKAEQARLATEAADLKTEKARLEARAAELAAEEQRLAELRASQAADYTARLADLERSRQAVPLVPAAEIVRDRPAVPPPRTTVTLPHAEDRSFVARDDETRPSTARARYARIDYDDARRACTSAGVEEAIDRDFYSARYQNSPQYDEGAREFRGLMRMEDRRGFILVDTICELDDEGRVVDFALLR